MKNPLARWIGVGALGAVMFGAAGLSSAKADDCYDRYYDRYRDRSDYRIEFRYDSRDRRGSHYYLDYDRYNGRRDYRNRDRDCDDRSHYRRHDNRRCD